MIRSLILLCLGLWTIQSVAQTTANLLDSAWYSLSSNPQQSLEILEFTLAQAEKEGNTEFFLQALEMKGMAYDELDYSNKAVELYLQVLEQRKAQNDPAYLVSLHINIGIVYDNMGQLTRAVEEYQQAYDISKEIGDYEGIALAGINLGTAYSEQGKIQESIAMLNSIALDSLSSATQCSVIMNRGLAWYRGGELEQALIDYLTAEKLVHDGPKPALAKVLLNLGKVYTEMELSEEAFQTLFRSWQLAQETSSLNNQLLTAENLSLAYEKWDYHEEALKWSRTGKELRDSIEHIRNTRYINTLNTVYEVEEKEKAIVQLERSQIERRNKFLLLSALSGIVILLLAVISISYRARFNQKTKEQQIQKLKLNQKEAALSHAQDELRMRTETLAEKNRILMSLQDRIDKTESSQMKSELIEQLEHKILTSEDWSNYRSAFMKVYPDFFELLMEKAPDLSNGDQRTAALIRQGLSNRAIAETLGISERSAMQNRYRLRKKLGFEELEELQSWIIEL